MKELILSYKEDLSAICLEGDGIGQAELKKVLLKLQDMYYPLVEDKHFHKDDKGFSVYLACYTLD